MTIEPSSASIYLATVTDPSRAAQERRPIYVVLASSREDALSAVQREVPKEHAVELTNHGLPVSETIKRLGLSLNQAQVLPPVP